MLTNRRTVKVRPFRLDVDALSTANVRGPVALEGSSLGSMQTFGDRPASSRTERRGEVAIVDVFGPLEQRATEWICGFSDGYDAIVERFEAALASDAKSVVLRIDSPGGAVAGLFEAVRTMTAAAAAAGKPVVAYVDELAASAGYALATVADRIIVPKSGFAGSIGCIIVHAEASRKLDREGIAVAVIRSGERKAEANSYEPLSAAARRELQRRVDVAARMFAELVALRRGKTAAAWLDLAGGILAGPEAVETGLADAMGTFADALAAASLKAGPPRAATSKARESASTRPPVVGSLGALVARGGGRGVEPTRGGRLALTPDERAYVRRNRLDRDKFLAEKARSYGERPPLLSAHELRHAESLGLSTVEATRAKQAGHRFEAWAAEKARQFGGRR